MENLRLAVDVGGTFTDMCILDENSGQIRIEKTASTPHDPIVGIMNGINKAGIDLNEVALFSHGTTVATNALITRRLPRAAMICSDGYRDVVEIRRGNRDELWDAYKDMPKPYIPRRDRLTVPERIDYRGNVLVDLDEDAAWKVARTLSRRGVEAVAVCFINAFLNGAHERRMREILNEVMPKVPVSISSEVMPEIFEHERFSTTMVNAVTSPVVVDYVERLGEELANRGYKQDLLLLHSGGGVMTPASVRDFSARLAGSGIAAGAIASRHIAGLCGYPNAIGLDMGGTSTDISLTYQGENRVTRDWSIEFGYPIRFPAIEIVTIGAGGGSLAWTDSAGSLKNGPQSAGADPGPACYGNGNMQATNTDANVVLGRLGTSLAGGKIELKSELSLKAVEQVANEHGMSSHEAAEAIVRVANANMADAVRVVSIGRGYDPRDFALVAFGGAGALHGVEVARELSIPAVIVPPNPGVTSALGCLLVDVQHDFTESFLRTESNTTPDDVEEGFKKLESEAVERLRNEGVADEDIVLQRSIDMMYEGQWRTLSVSVPESITGIAELTEAFHREYEREFAYRRDETPVEFFNLQLKAIGVVPKAELAVSEESGDKPDPISHREVWFDNQRHMDTPVYNREDLPAGFEITGPAIVEQFDSTVVIPPNSSARIDKYSNLVIVLKD